MTGLIYGFALGFCLDGGKKLKIKGAPLLYSLLTVLAFYLIVYAGYIFGDSGIGLFLQRLDQLMVTYTVFPALAGIYLFKGLFEGE
ncbi:MAG: hypothetical protein Q4C55_07100 [Eubacterium sp.]|nr:hypothetical protein [Eubacterium sp.]